MGPILLVCLSNHALDSMQVDILDAAGKYSSSTQARVRYMYRCRQWLSNHELDPMLVTDCALLLFLLGVLFDYVVCQRLVLAVLNQ